MEGFGFDFERCVYRRGGGGGGGAETDRHTEQRQRDRAGDERTARHKEAGRQRDGEKERGRKRG